MTPIKPRIYCIGNFGIDVRVTPRNVSAHAAGTALRCTLGAALFGVPLQPVAAIGPEDLFAPIIQTLVKRGVSLEHLEAVEHSMRFTTTYDDSNEIMDFQLNYPHIAQRVGERSQGLDVESADMMVVCPLPFHSSRELLRKCHEASVLSFLVIHYSQFEETPAVRFSELVEIADYVILNVTEGAQITRQTTVSDIGESLSHLCKGAVILTKHQDGVAVFQRGIQIARQPSLAIEVRNVLGAGDTFAGGVIAGLWLTGEITSAITYGSLAANLVLAEPDHKLLLRAIDL